MTTPTKEQVVQWAEQSGLQTEGRSEFAYTDRIYTFMELARADLEATLAELQQQVDFWQKDHQELQQKDDAIIAEHAKEIERLYRYVETAITLNEPEYKQLRQQLAESQAREGKLREALRGQLSLEEGLLRGPCDIDLCCETRASLAALELPSDDTALREALAAARSAGIEVAIKYLKKKADDFAATYGSDDLGSLSFGRGSHAEAKFDYYNSLLDLAEEIAAIKGEEKEDF